MRLRDYAVLMTLAVVAARPAEDDLSGLMEEYYNWSLSQFPETAISRGMYEDRLTNMTLENYAQIKDTCNDFLERLKKIKKEGLEGQSLDNYEVFEVELTTIVKGYAWVQYGTLTPINFLYGELQAPSWPLYVVVDEEKDHVNYVKRLRAYVVQVGQGIELMKLAIKLNRTLHNVTVKDVPEIIESRIDYSNMSVFLYPYARDTFKDSFPEDKGWTLYGEAEDFVFNEVNPALKNLIKFIKDVQRRLDFTGTFPEFFTYLRENRTSDFFGLTEEEILERYKNILIKRINPKMKMVSSKNPNKKLMITTQANNGPPASYGLPGIFYVNTRQPSSRDTYTMMSIALHEGNPGHHLQLTLQNTLHLPKFRQSFHSLGINNKPFDFPLYTAYIEGWALYAEFLGEELDLYNTSALELFGRYTAEMLRACRLVVDTGIHAFGWSKERAVKYLVDRVAMAEHQLEKEIDRYVSYPGQACSYKIGEIEIKKLREEAKRKMGGRFDVVAFNDVVLMSGAAPLTVVERAVHAYIKASSGTRIALSAGLFHFAAGMAVLLQMLL